MRRNSSGQVSRAFDTGFLSPLESPAKIRPSFRAAIGESLLTTMEDLFPEKTSPDFADAPLATRMRPTTLEEYAGQQHILGPGKLLRRAIEADRVSSLILFGPPGTGKTTLAQVIAGATKSRRSRFACRGSASG